MSQHLIQVIQVEYMGALVIAMAYELTSTGKNIRRKRKLDRIPNIPKDAKKKLIKKERNGVEEEQFHYTWHVTSLDDLTYS